MSLNAALRLMAGVVILVSLGLGTYMHPNWFYLTGFVGLNLFQSGFTKWCPAVFIFQKIGLKAETCSSEGMSVNQGVHIIAGSVVLLTVGLVLFAGMTANLLIVTAIVGLSLTQSAFTGWCPAMMVASMLGCKKTVAV
ncbi:YgaP family membrane protein [Neptuniibacter sp.]|uniref:YgaP family membrane protein n=1 Tax=Neptuniibacter sp. TaxID=1962643 RepID=UPI003B5BF5E4